MESSLSEKIKFMAQMVEKFVEHNIVEKEQRDENLRKLANAFDGLVKNSRAPIENIVNNPKIKDTFEKAQNVVRDAYTQAAANYGRSETGGQTTAACARVPLKVKKLENFQGDLPKYQTPLASGFDVRAQLTEELVLNPGQRALVPTGLSFAIPAGFEIQARPRSGAAIRDGLSLVNTPGTIDADYRGEVKIILINLGNQPVTIKDQDRIAQLVLAPVIQAEMELVEELDSTERGAGGFGSTGKH